MTWPFRIKQPAALVEAHDTIDRLIKDVTYWQDRALTAGRLSSEVMRERDALQARLDALTPARDPVTKRFVGKAMSNG